MDIEVWQEAQDRAAALEKAKAESEKAKTPEYGIVCNYGSIKLDDKEIRHFAKSVKSNKIHK